MSSQSPRAKRQGNKDPYHHDSPVKMTIDSKPDPHIEHAFTHQGKRVTSQKDA
jgi:hypothetical protein